MKQKRRSSIHLLNCFASILLLVGFLGIAGCSNGGSGVDRRVQISNIDVNFGNVVLDHFEDQVITLQNNGNTTGYLDAINPAQLNLPFSIIDDGCSGKALAPAGQCSLMLRFEPTNYTGFYEGALLITEQTKPACEIDVSGNAFALNVSINQVDTSGCPGTVKLLVSITDRYDNPVTGLGQSCFTLYENDILIDDYPGDPTLSFANLTHPLTDPFSSALALDFSGSTQPYVDDIKAAAKSFVEQLTLEPNPEPDEVKIFKFAATVESMTGFSSDKAVLDSAIDQDPQLDTSKTALYQAISQAVADIHSRNERRAVLVLSDGINEGVTGYSLDETVGYAQDEGVPIFTIAVGQAYLPVLQYLSNETGGQHFQTETYSNLETVFDQIASLLSNQYLIEYSSASCGNGTATIDLSVDLPNSDHGEDSLSIDLP